MSRIGVAPSIRAQGLRSLRPQPAFSANFVAGPSLAQRGGTLTFSRATPRTIIDHEGKVRTILANEAPFEGYRRVRNLLSLSEDYTTAAWLKSNGTIATGVDDPLGGSAASTFTAAGANALFQSSANSAVGNVYTNSLWIRRRAGTGTVNLRNANGVNIDITSLLSTTQWKRFSSTVAASGAAARCAAEVVTSGDAIDVFGGQVEDVTDQAVQNPGEYVSVGVRASPYHGPGVDGVKYFTTENGNVVQQNMLARSQEFDNASWGKTAVGTGVAPTVVANDALAPDGTLTADRITLNRGAGDTIGDSATIGLAAVATVAGAKYTGSVYLKGTLGEKVAIRHAGKATYTLHTFTGGWDRFESIETAVDTTAGLLDLADRGTTGSTRNVTFWAWGAQLQPGRRAGTYVATTTAAVNNQIVEEATGTALNPTTTIKGLNPYDNCTNVCLQSEDFGTTWVAVGTPTRSAAAKRCGDVVLDLIGDDDGAVLERYQQTIAFTGNAVKAISVFVAQGTSTSSVVQLTDTTALTQRLTAAITWAAGAPVVAMTAGTLEGTDTLGDGVFRLRFTTTAVTAANNNDLRISPATDAAGNVVPTGNAYFGGVQVENAGRCAPYIKTTTASVAVNADFPSNNPVGSWFNATEGTVVVEARTPAVFTTNAHVMAEFRDGTSNNRIISYQDSAQRPGMFMNVAGVTQVGTTGTIITVNTIFRHALRYKTNDSAYSTNGAAAVVDNLCSIPVVDRFNLGCGTSNTEVYRGHIRKVDYYNRALTDFQLQRLSG